MDLTIIENNYLSVKINRIGAEITSIINKKNNENIIWDAKTHWKNHAPVLFPIVGGLIDDEYTFSDKLYSLKRHGFARHNNDFELFSSRLDNAVFKLESNNNTLRFYPFKFRLIISFNLVGNRLEVKHQIKNLDDKKMYYSIGGHPAFSLSNSILDYSLMFEKQEEFIFPLLNKNGQRTGDKIKLSESNNLISLNEHSFNRDAWIFEDPKSSWIKLISEKSDTIVTVHLGDFKQLGIWSKPEANYVCIEPWLGVADHDGHNKKIEEKDGILDLLPDHEDVHSFTIEVV